MATSAFKSTTKRASIGRREGSSSEESSRRSLRRSRSVSRFSRPIAAEDESVYNKSQPRGKFVNTKRGSSEAASFPEISLDDLALEFFSSSSLNENESDGGKQRVGRWASDTASSRRRGRSVSRSRENVVSSSGAKNTISSRSVSRSRENVVSSSGAKNAISSSAAGSRRRRSLSVARYHQISDSESEIDHSRSSSKKTPISKNGQLPLVSNSINSTNRKLGKSWSHKDLSLLLDGYSSHSSALTDDESKDTRSGKNGSEKIIRAVHAQKKAEHPTEDATNGVFYEAIRKELRYAVEEMRTELNQVALGRNHTDLAVGECLQSDNSCDLQDFSGIRNNYATKLGKLSSYEQGHDVSKMVKKLPDSKTSVLEKPSGVRKRSCDRNRMSKRLTEDAEKLIEDFLSNVEDTDLSSFDGERSDGSSTLGGTMKSRNAVIREAEPYKSPTGYTSRPVEMDGVNLPWLQWEASPDGSLSGKNNVQTPVTPKALQWDSGKDMVILHDPSNFSTSSHGSWSPGHFSNHTDIREDIGKTTRVSNDKSSFDMDEYLTRPNNEEILFDMYKERNRIGSGGLLLCTGFLY
ncbi:hypothetical protein ACJIZ3_004489 [Penstemon smallii]|uniref:Uncharacterized protein n=1 Tax=Penstemon smallii TaxID=265156 RepID=A0ABD3S274_9LAMI